MSLIKQKILLNIEATPSCPATCSMCPRDLIGEEGFMSLETMERIISQVDKDSFWEIDLAGRGEPTIHPKFDELITIMKKSHVPTSVVTTAVAFTEKNARSAAANLDMIRLSVSSYNKSTFDKVHIGLNFYKIWKNISSIASFAAEKTTIHLTGGPVIYDHLHETVAHLRSLGFRRIHLFPLWNRGGAFEHQNDMERRLKLIRDLELLPAEVEYSGGAGRITQLANLAAGKLQNKNYCGVGASSLSIAYDGKILGCFQDFGHTSIIGNVHNGELRKLLQTRHTRVGNMPVCIGCDANKVAISPLKKMIFPIKAAL